MRYDPLNPANYMKSRQLKVNTKIQGKTQSGEGLGDIYKWVKEKGLNIGKKALTKAYELYGSDTATMLKNMLPDSDNLATTQYAGERHVPLKLENGKFGIASYMGPGTHILTRLRSSEKGNIHGRTESDLTAKAHDIRYTLSKAETDPEKRNSMIRDADNRMVRGLQKVKREKLDNDFNINLGMRSMQGKMALEDLGVLSKGSFGSKKSEPLSQAERDLLEENLKKLEQKGYGKYSKLLKIAKAQLKGKGVRQSGKGINVKASSNDVVVGDSKDWKPKQDIVLRASKKSVMVGDNTENYKDIVEQSGKGVRQSGNGVVRAGATPKRGGAYKLLVKELSKLPDMSNLSQKVKENMKKAKSLKEMTRVIYPALNLKGKGMPKEKDLKKLLEDLKRVKTGSGKSTYKKIIRGSGFWSKLWKNLKHFYKGASYGWNKTKEVLGSLPIPVVKEVLKHIPDAPNAPKSFEELKQQTKGSGLLNQAKALCK